MWARAQCVEAARPMLKVKAHGATFGHYANCVFTFGWAHSALGGRHCHVACGGAWPRNVSIPVTAVFLYQCTVVLKVVLIALPLCTDQTNSYPWSGRLQQQGAQLQQEPPPRPRAPAPSTFSMIVASLLGPTSGEARAGNERARGPRERGWVLQQRICSGQRSVSGLSFLDLNFHHACNVTDCDLPTVGPGALPQNPHVLEFYPFS